MWKSRDNNRCAWSQCWQLNQVANLNLNGKLKEWFKHLNLAPSDWITLWGLMVAKFKVVDDNEIFVKLETIPEEHK